MTKTMIEPETAAAVAWEYDQFHLRAMNTDVHCALIAPRPEALRGIVEGTFRYFEGLLSRFRPGSELCRLNACAEPYFFAGADLYAAIEAAMWAAQQTGGIYDPTILPCLEAAGYDRTFDAIAQPAPPLALERPSPAGGAPRVPSRPRRADYRLVGLEPFTRTISRPPGVRFDLGGMGKGWTVDRIVDALAGKGHLLLNAGGDLYAYGEPQAGRGWQVHLAHPLLPGRQFATLEVKQGALATSTVARRRWLNEGVVQHHLIDPRHGRPARTDIVSASVLAGRVFTAEVFAKTALILGRKAGLAFLAGQDDVEGALVDDRGAIHLTRGFDALLTRLDPAGYAAA